MKMPSYQFGTSEPRMNWDIAFEKMAKRGDDVLLDPEEYSTSWDQEEWEWQNSDPDVCNLVCKDND